MNVSSLTDFDQVCNEQAGAWNDMQSNRKWEIAVGIINQFGDKSLVLILCSSGISVIG